MDIRGAYLNGELKEEVYMRQPPGFEDGTGRVWRLKKSIYGLHQSGRDWNREFDRKVQSVGLTKTAADNCVYYRERDGEQVWVTVWVDDLIILATSKDEGERVRKELGTLFEMKDMGEPRKIIGIEVTRDRSAGTVTLSQRHYIESLLDRYGFSNLNAVSTPLVPDANTKMRQLPKDAPPAAPSVRAEYQSMIGGLMYAAICTRPDIAYAVGRLSQFAANPGPEHQAACKRVFRYLSGTRNYGLVYGPQRDGVVFEGYCDADYAANLDDRKSISGYAYMLAGAAFAWSSKKQTTVATSTTEAEFTSLAQAARFAMWCRNLFAGIGYSQDDATVLYGDNQSALKLTRNPEYHAQSKHFDVSNMFVREKVALGIIDTVYCPTDEQLADIFTKALAEPRHLELTRMLGLWPV
uniref:Reverse transcriptase Ty1/copia-type domain-containing protein n=1 Tax=Mycena chlorophos TaxID=658473 RepID=A0ABQ0L0M8_MYCCL|nr:predicted protein [Mycena chlorophos]